MIRSESERWLGHGSERYIESTWLTSRQKLSTGKEGGRDRYMYSWLVVLATPPVAMGERERETNDWQCMYKVTIIIMRSTITDSPLTSLPVTRWSWWGISDRGSAVSSHESSHCRSPPETNMTNRWQHKWLYCRQHSSLPLYIPPACSF